MEQQYTYTVCIHCMTYNQKPYILDALHGFTMQQTNFPYVALVMDDASNDGEPEVLRQYITEQCDISSMTTKDDELYELVEINAKDNPNCHFAFYFLRENQWRTGKKKPIIDEWGAKAKYIACCEGDDYWINSLKLQKQVDYLDAHDDCILCFHRSKIYDVQTNSMREDPMQDVQGKSTNYDLAKVSNFIETASVVYRNNYSYRKLREQFGVGWPGDYISWMLLGEFGYYYKLPDVMSVYRWGNGCWSSRPDFVNKIDFLCVYAQLYEIIKDEGLKIILLERINEYKKMIINDYLYIWQKLETLRNIPGFHLLANFYKKNKKS